MADHLAGHADLLSEIVEEGSFVLKQIAAWAATHHVAFKMIDPERVHVLLYEEVVSDTERELRRLNSFLAREDRRGLKARDFTRPSWVSSAASVDAVHQDPGAWRRDLPAKEIDGGLRVLDAFGLAGLYEDGRPVRGEFEKLFHGVGRLRQT